MTLILLSLAHSALTPGSREYRRMQLYAKEVDALHVIVLVRHHTGNAIHDGPLHIHPTCARTRVGMVFSAIREVRKILSSITDRCVISAQDPLEIGWLAWFLTRGKNVELHIQIHGDYFGTDAWVGKNPIRYIRRIGARILLRHVPRIRVVSRRILKSLVDIGIQESRITLLPIRPELESFLTHTYEGKSNSIIFNYVGRFAYEKNISLIIDAFARVQKKYQDVQLRLIGSGSERDKLQAHIQELNLTDKAHIIPWTDEIVGEMAEGSVTVLASRHEAYALVLLESLALGIPVITTDVGCVGELVQDNIHGVVVRSAVEDLSHAMQRMIEDPLFRQACGERGKTRMQELASHTEEAYAHDWARAHMGVS